MAFAKKPEHLARLCVAAKLRFLEYRHPVHGHLKTTASGRFQAHLGLGKVLANRGRQTDGPRFVVSNSAVFDHNLHKDCRRGCYPCNFASATALAPVAGSIVFLISCSDTMRRSLLTLLLALAPLPAAAQPRLDALQSEIDRRTAAITDKLTEWRHDIHQHPELSNFEVRTARLVSDHLKALGLEVRTEVGGHGVVAVLRGGKPGPVVALRAEMDALPVVEQVNVPFKSTTKTVYNGVETGVMHACGHDGHTAMLLAAAKHIAQKGQFSGTVNLIFQPAEEGLGGAVKMMEDGLFTKYPCNAIFAMHNMPSHPQGKLVFRDGPAMASSDNVTITLEGVGGHGAVPHKAVDSIVAGSAIVMALQTIVSRNVDPLHTAVVTVGALHAGQAKNVIPALATMELSVRALDPQVRQLLEQRIKALVVAQAESFGVKADIDWRPGYSVLVNSAAETDFARQVALALVGPERVTLNGPALTGSEDFAFMLEKVPGSYLLIGNGDGDSAGACMVHNPGYDFNDDNIATGAAYWAALVQAYLATEKD